MSIQLNAFRLVRYNMQTRPPVAPAQPPVAIAASPVVATDALAALKAIRQEAERLLAAVGSWLVSLGPVVPATTPAPRPQPSTPTPTLPVGGKEPATRVIAEQAYSRDKNSAIQKMYREESKRQSARAKIAPGVTVGGKHDPKHRRIRDIAASSATEKAHSAKALTKTSKGYQGPTIQNPNTASGRFDPHTYQPVWLFDAKEDSFPVRPDYDGNGSVKNDLKAYDHGVVGGKQALEGAFTVTQRGEYVVHTYSLNYVDNKFTNYHDLDSSTVSIYLKQNAKGKLEPAYVYTSAHYHGTLTAWKDIKKDGEGHPIIRVERGSHALHPYGNKEKIPTDGLQIKPDGQATLNGKALPNRMTWLTLQKNIDNARYLDPSKSANMPVWSRFLGGYPERRQPYHPSFFK